MGKYSDLFQAFWQLYPRRSGKIVGKVATYEKFRQLSPEDQLLCCRACGVYAQSYARPLKPKEFRAEPRDPERFLRNDWWRDWLTEDSIPAAPCQFRSMVPCDDMALSGEKYCTKHKTEAARLAEIRKRHEVPA